MVDVDHDDKRLGAIDRPDPIEPPPSEWLFPAVDVHRDDEIVAIGADLLPGTLLAAYRTGVFPMPVDSAGRIGWWSPDPRGVLELDDLRVSRSLRRSLGRYEVTCNQNFARVIECCGELPRDGAWITGDIVGAYVRLHALGWAHSVEVWNDVGDLVGGLYGVGIGGLFAGESMFATATDASKVALVTLVDRLRQAGTELLDVQWSTPHLASLGVTEMARVDYLERLRDALMVPANQIGQAMGRSTKSAHTP